MKREHSRRGDNKRYGYEEASIEETGVIVMSGFPFVCFHNEKCLKLSWDRPKILVK